MIQAHDLLLLEHLSKTRQMTITYFDQLLRVGVDAYHATVVSQALARLSCERIPPNPLQRQSLLFCWDAIQQAGILSESSIEPNKVLQLS